MNAKSGSYVESVAVKPLDCHAGRTWPRKSIRLHSQLLGPAAAEECGAAEGTGTRHTPNCQ